VLDSRQVAPAGMIIAIEPNPIDYSILEQNICRNKCSNVTPINIGAAANSGVKIMRFWDTSFTFKTNTLHKILERAYNTAGIDFIKMDIEGFEYDVIRTSLDIFRGARIIVLEFHGTKEKIDDLLLPMGFTYHPVTISNLFKTLTSKMFSHPIHFLRASLSIIKDHPKFLFSVPLGYTAEIPEGLFMEMIQDSIGSKLYTVEMHWFIEFFFFIYL
jgi:FkbM family methyltransferase